MTDLIVHVRLGLEVALAREAFASARGQGKRLGICLTLTFGRQVLRLVWLAPFGFAAGVQKT